MEDSRTNQQNLKLQAQTEQVQSPQTPVSKPKTQWHFLLEMIAISGEYPAENIHRLIPSESYAKKVVLTLISGNLLKSVHKDGVRGYRLASKAKKMLLTAHPARFGDCLVGSADTNKQRSTLSRRLRLHSAAEVYTLMHNAGIRIFKDDKPEIFTPDASANHSQSALSQPALESALPCFYSSREQKGDDDKSNSIRGSRAAGTLFTPTHVYAIYNSGNSVIPWYQKNEAYFRVYAQDTIRRKVFHGQYNGVTVGGIMIGKDMEALERYLVTEGKERAAHKFLEHAYRPFYFITNDDKGEAQLKLLCDNAKMNEVKNGVFKGLHPPDKNYPVEHDALTEDGNPVLFCCLPDIPKLIKFRRGIHLHGKAGKLIAFDFQKEMLERYLGTEIEIIKFIIFEKFAARFFPDA